MALTPLALRLSGPSTAYYQSHPRARRHKVTHQAAINRRPSERRRRAALNSERRRRGIYAQGGPDVSHTTSGDTVLEAPSTNRARNGAGGRPRLRSDSGTVFLNRRLHAQVKAKAKRLFDVYPSAYANAWMVKEYKRLGGKFRSDALDTWFKERWVRMSSTGRILGPCGDRTEGEGKPKCLPLARAQALTPGARRTLVARKRRRDPDKNRSGAPIMVSSTTDAEGDGKKYTKTVTNPETGRTRRIRYGASGYRIAPGTNKGDRYCARSFGDMKSHGKDCSGPDRNTPLCLSRAKWRCSGKTSRRDALPGLTPLTVLGVVRIDAPPENGSRGKPCGKSHIPKNHKCGKKTGLLTAGNLRTAAKVALGAGLLAGGAYLASQRRKPNINEWRNALDDLKKNPKLSSPEAARITDEAIAHGQKWDVQEGINAHRKAEIDAMCGGLPGKTPTLTKLDAKLPARCKLGSGSYGTYYVHPSQDYGIKVLGRGGNDEFNNQIYAFKAGVNVPEPLAFRELLKGGKRRYNQVLVMRHLKGYETLEDHFNSLLNIRGASTLEKLKFVRMFRTLNVSGMAHGDIHGENILYNPRSHKFALIDFGYSRHVTDPKHPIHYRNGVDTLMSDLFDVPRFVGVDTSYLSRQTHNISLESLIIYSATKVSTLDPSDPAWNLAYSRMDLGIRRYYDYIEAQIRASDPLTLPRSARPSRRP